MKRSGKKHECDDCGARWTDWEILRPPRIRDYFKRVAPGEIAPSGECKQCGALTHLIRPVGVVRALHEAALTAIDRMARLVDASNPDGESEKATLELDQEALAQLREAVQLLSGKKAT